jgi:ABC-type spermidine/putrescine transport system permease subunit II
MGKKRFNYILYAFCAFVFVFLSLPIFIVIPISFSSTSYLQFPPSSLSLKWYVDLWHDTTYFYAVMYSLQIGVLTVFLSMLLGVPASFALVRSEFRGKNFITSFIISPKIISHIIISIAIYKMYAEMHLVGSIWGMTLAHTVIVIPFIILNTSSVLRGLDINLERAAQILGANRLIAFFTVIFPLLRPGLYAGALLSFIISFDEIVIAMFICGTKRTLPVRIWEDIRLELTPTLAAISSILICLSVTIFCLAAFFRKKSEAKLQE